jgi:hypothetical protein
MLKILLNRIGGVSQAETNFNEGFEEHVEEGMSEYLTYVFVWCERGHDWYSLRQEGQVK